MVSGCSPNPNGGGLDASGTVTGVLVDGVTNAPLASANVFIGGSAVTLGPGSQGGFVLRNVPIGPQTLTINVIGYTVIGGTGPGTLQINVQRGPATTDLGVIRMQSVGGAQALPTQSPAPR